ncbi:hypothetical protein EG329_014463 [Mollisiaceae sp. DMI_Dod_QoI]|nr:hypothetical protein EG329_014463 [Helotiales sp. DMI_Dod_QoI]
MNANSPDQHSHHQSPKETPKSSKPWPPSPLCRWSIHVHEVQYEQLDSPEPPENLADPNDETTWTPWPAPAGIHEFAESLQDNLESNEFSTIELRELPISSGQIARAAKRSPEQLLEEAFGFSIMARNQTLVDDMIQTIRKKKDFEFHDLFPMHLAASYLDGSGNCCNIFNGICLALRRVPGFRKLHTNHLGHTVLDNLMIAILKAHTSCTPVMVDEAFRKEHRFAGEEVDICGSWKHMFCHTSAQAIIHCIGTMYVFTFADVNTPSGLFLKRCLNETCGLKLQLKPLHTLVITAVYLAQLGNDGENLFGVVACLLSLLQHGANPLLKAHISLTALLSGDESEECSHSELDPLELARRVPQDLISKWSQERITGWKIFCAVLRLSQDSLNRPVEVYIEDEANSDEEDEEEEEEEDEDKYCSEHSDDEIFCKSRTLSSLWAAVQTELLTYRRIAEGDPWISANFDMESVLESLEAGNDLCIGLVSKNMMKSFCQCGNFEESRDPVCSHTDEACAYYFSNLDDWSRSTFLHMPYRG